MSHDRVCSFPQVGKLSMDWKTEDNTKVTGTYPPLARQEKKWTGYVEKDTAGQTNIYAVEVRSITCEVICVPDACYDDPVEYATTMPVCSSILVSLTPTA